MARQNAGDPGGDQGSPTIDLDAEVDALYAGDPERFTAERDGLAKRLKAAGRKDEAAEVKRLRRPTVAARAVNLVARTRGDDLARLRGVGAELRRAQDQALQRGKGERAADTLRELGSRRRALVAALAEAAVAAMADAGADGGAGAGGATSHRADIVATFEAVAADDAAADEVARGRLARPLEAPVGFGGSEGEDAEIVVLDDGPRRAAKASSSRRATGGAQRDDKPGAVHVLDGAEVRKARARAVKAREAMEAAGREVARLETALTTARQELARAKEAAARAEAAAGAADR